MKRLIIGLIAATLMGGGLVGTTAAASNAGPRCPVYTGCVKTETTLSVPRSVKRNQRATICVKVVSRNGNGKPKGTVSVKVQRTAGGYSYRAAGAYNGRTKCFTTGKLRKKGKYAVTADFNGKGAFLDSHDNATFRVKR